MENLPTPNPPVVTPVSQPVQPQVVPKIAKLSRIGTKILLYFTLFLAGYITAKFQTLFNSL